MILTLATQHRFALRALSSLLAAIAISGLLGCGDGDRSKELSNATPTPASSKPSPDPTNTQAALAKFWERYGARDSFPAMYVDILENTLLAEDKVLAKDYTGARTIVDKLLAKYPLSDDVWWTIFRTGEEKSTRPHLGEPGAYAHMRMLDEITKIGVTKSLAGSKPIQMAVVMPACSDIVPKAGPTLLNHRLSPEIEENSYEVVHQSLRLFQSYILAISNGELRLELNFYKVNECFQIKKETGFVVGNYTAPVSQLPAGVADKSDMFWLIYPSDNDAGLDIGQGGGMGAFGDKPFFISEDDWVIRKVAYQGGGARTEVERRLYLPEWVQHEFLHHLFSSWPEFGLEKTGHQWFTRTNWPADFVGGIEEDYYSEALRKRLYTATPSIAQKLQRANPAK